MGIATREFPVNRPSKCECYILHATEIGLWQRAHEFLLQQILLTSRRISDDLNFADEAF